MVLASLTKLGIRQRCAQASQAARSAIAASGVGLVEDDGMSEPSFDSPSRRDRGVRLGQEGNVAEANHLAELGKQPEIAPAPSCCGCYVRGMEFGVLGPLAVW